jgi:TetR/AcrR family tetracycline transcriptional repressor
MARPKSTSVEERLGRDRIVVTGLRLLEDHGLERLSLRAIAEALGVQTPALYWHIRDRGQLLGLMAEERLRQTLDGLDPSTSGYDFLMEFARAIARDHIESRDLARLVAISAPTDGGYVQIQSRIHARLAVGGVERPQQALMAVFSFTLGWSLFMTNPAMREHLSQAMNPEGTFEAGLGAIAAGFGYHG